MKAKALILTGDGINCERETAAAFEHAGISTKIIHINDLLESPNLLEKFQALALPGGFSFGDDLGSGQVLSLKLESVLQNELQKFIKEKKPIIGICNGFQALTKLGLLPYPFQNRVAALARNNQGHFQNRWVELEVDNKTHCIWTKNLDQLQLPIRHGEGKIVFSPGEEENIHRELSANGQIPLRYKNDVNGSYGRTAALCDSSGVIFGLMPHPEAALIQGLYPNPPNGSEKLESGYGAQFFINCASYLKER